MIKVTTFVLRLATAILSMGVVCAAYGTGQPQATGSVQLTGSDNGFCQFFGLKNGCDANYVLQSTLYDDESVAGKLTDVYKFDDKNTVLVQGDVDCMKFFAISGAKYVVVGGVYTTGDKLIDIYELDAPIVDRRFVAAAKEEEGVVYNSGSCATCTNDEYADFTCDDIDATNVEEILNFYENDGQATIVFPSDPVTCGDFDGKKKECRKSKQCGWDTNEETCSVSTLGVFRGESLSKEEAPIQDMANGSDSVDPKMIMSGMVAGLFFALWL